VVVINYNQTMKKSLQANELKKDFNSLSTHSLEFLEAGAQRAVEQFLEQGTPPNTVRSYAAAFAYLQAWYRLRFDADIAAISQGPVFVRLLRGGKPAKTALSGNHIALIVKRRAQLAGLQGDWAAHSLRSGFITEAGRQNMAIPDVMAMTDHHSVNTLMAYYQAGELLAAPVANLLANAAEPDPQPST